MIDFDVQMGKMMQNSLKITNLGHKSFRIALRSETEAISEIFNIKIWVFHIKIWVFHLETRVFHKKMILSISNHVFHYKNTVYRFKNTFFSSFCLYFQRQNFKKKKKKKKKNLNFQQKPSNSANTAPIAPISAPPDTPAPALSNDTNFSTIFIVKSRANGPQTHARHAAPGGLPRLEVGARRFVLEPGVNVGVDDLGISSLFRGF
jgi:hypothetical protein